MHCAAIAAPPKAACGRDSHIPFSSDSAASMRFMAAARPATARFMSRDRRLSSSPRSASRLFISSI